MTIAMAVVTLALAAAAQKTAKGVVFNDANGNGLRDGGEAGIPDVSVSNGVDVVTTDASGAWSLPVDDDTTLFVIKPPHWAVSLDAHNRPRYFYIHKPEGSPALAVPGVAPTGPLPASVDFALTRKPEPERFTTVFLGDPQARGMREVGFVTHDVVDELIGTDAAFVVTLGDIVADDAGLFDPISQIVGKIGPPCYYIFGNHDTNRDATEDKYRDETFELVFGPPAYAFEVANVAFIALNNVFKQPGAARGTHFPDDQLAFVRNYLEHVPEDRLVVLMMHVPVVGCRNRDALYRIIENRPHTFSVSAHAHEQHQKFLTDEDGWRGATPHHHLVAPTVSGCWWCGTFDEVGIPHATMNDGAPNGYTFITFDGNRYSFRFKAARRPADYQMNIYAPDEIALDALSKTEVLVNVFMGNEKSKTELRLGDGPWLPMDQTTTTDPEILRMHEQNPALNEEVFGWEMDAPSKTRHMWRSTLPATVDAGAHTLTVRTTDMFGQQWSAHRIIRVVP
ncbi:MAG: metallophosphoesterase [bacterium]|nr:metallophosphoesterase [bacterium]